MKMKTKSILYAALLLAVMYTMITGVNAQPKGESSATEDIWKSIEQSYYLSNNDSAAKGAAAQLSISDPYGVIDTDAKIDMSKVIETFDTGTNSKQALLTFSQSIETGSFISSSLSSRNEFYTITKNSNGEENGFALLKPASDSNGISVVAFGEINALCRQDLQVTEALKSKLKATGMNLSNTNARHCMINNSSVGVLFFDGKQEYYMPTAETFESLTLLQLGELYPPMSWVKSSRIILIPSFQSRKQILHRKS